MASHSVHLNDEPISRVRVRHLGCAGKVAVTVFISIYIIYVCAVGVRIRINISVMVHSAVYSINGKFHIPE